MTNDPKPDEPQRMRDTISTTPMAEYLDMLYTRLAIELGKPEVEMKVRKWWLELHPPVTSDEGVGIVRIKALGINNWTTYNASMHAVQKGAIVPLHELEIVIEYHINKFVEALNG